MIRGTTPTFTLRIRNGGADIRLASKIVFSIVQGGKEIVKTEEDIEVADSRTVRIFLAQEESLSLKEGASAEIQLNWIYTDPDGITRRAATKTREIRIDRQLYGSVIE